MMVEVVDPLELARATRQYGDHWAGRDDRLLTWVKVAGPDEHRTFFSKPEDQRPGRIVPCPYAEDLPGLSRRQVVIRPAFKHDRYWWQLSQEIHQWILDLDYQYAVNHRWDGQELGWKVGFQDPREAMAFKLAWWRS